MSFGANSLYDSGRGMMHVNEIIFIGDHVKIGRWRLPASHPNFRDSGPTRHYLVVFPRTSTWIQHAGGDPFPSDANNVTYYNQHQEYTRRPISPQGDWCEYYAIAPELLRQIVSTWDPRAADEEARILTITHGPSDAETYLLQRRVYRHVRDTRATDALFVEETMMRVVERLLGMAYGASARPVARHRDLVHHARELIGRRFWTPFTIGSLAQATGVSAFHLCRVFREHTGLTIHAYRNQLRLRGALERVIDQRCDLTDVALSLGYSSHSHFTAAFRAAYGITPSALTRMSVSCWPARPSSSSAGL
jgi:AraC family transcriptional regulator